MFAEYLQSAMFPQGVLKSLLETTPCNEQPFTFHIGSYYTSKPVSVEQDGLFIQCVGRLSNTVQEGYQDFQYFAKDSVGEEITVVRALICNKYPSQEVRCQRSDWQRL